MNLNICYCRYSHDIFMGFNIDVAKSKSGKEIHEADDEGSVEVIAEDLPLPSDDAKYHIVIPVCFHVNFLYAINVNLKQSYLYGELDGICVNFKVKTYSVQFCNRRKDIIFYVYCFDFS